MHQTRHRFFRPRSGTGLRIHDVRSESVGGWAGPVEPDAPVGKFAGPPRRRRQAAGGWSGEPDRQRQGCFADAEPVQEEV